MKRWSKFGLVIIALLMVASMLMATTLSGKTERINMGQDKTVFLGRAGVSYTDSYYTGTIQIRRMDDKGKNPPKHFFFTQKLLDVRFYDQNWTNLKVVTGAVYVYFTLRGQEKQAFDQGRLGIYYWDTWKYSWKACPSFLSQGGSRIACRIRNYGSYGLLYRDP